MDTANSRVLEWAIEKTRHEYAGDVCLLAVYGSYLDGTAGPLSDVDFYFVPRNRRAYQLGRTFIIGSVGYDLFPLSWERLAGLASLDESLTPLLGNCSIVYYGSRQDTKRFEALQTVLARNLADRSFMHQKAAGKLSGALAALRDLLAQSDLRACRSLSGDILLLLADAVACENMTYFRHGLKSQMADIERMSRLPDGFVKNYGAVIDASTAPRIKAACLEIVASVAGCLNSGVILATGGGGGNGVFPASPHDDLERLASLYGEIISTFNKIYGCCESQNAVLAFIYAVLLQHELDRHVGGIRFDILSDYDSADLRPLGARVKSVESELLSYIAGGAKIPQYASVEAFLSGNR